MTALLVAAGAAIMTIVGGFTALHASRHRHLVLGLAAGLMLGVVGFELLPESLRQNHALLWATPVPLVFFVSGYLLVHVVERSWRCTEVMKAPTANISISTPRARSQARPWSPTASSTASPSASPSGQLSHRTAVAVAVIAHDFADGFNTYTLTNLHGDARTRGLILLTADAAAPVVGAALAMTVTISPTVLGAYLGLFAGVLLYLATADVLPEAHQQNSSPSRWSAPSRVPPHCSWSSA